MHKIFHIKQANLTREQSLYHANTHTHSQNIHSTESSSKIEIFIDKLNYMQFSPVAIYFVFSQPH